MDTRSHHLENTNTALHDLIPPPPSSQGKHLTGITEPRRKGDEQGYQTHGKRIAAQQKIRLKTKLHTEPPRLSLRCKKINAGHSCKISKNHHPIPRGVGGFITKILGPALKALRHVSPKYSAALHLTPHRLLPRVDCSISMLQQGHIPTRLALHCCPVQRLLADTDSHSSRGRS